MPTLENSHILSVKPLISPAVLAEELPTTKANAATVTAGREGIQAILDGRDARRFVVVGPCSIHDPKAAVEYADKLALAKAQFPNLLLVMRVYFEKPRTVVGWKGLINDPDIDGSFRINHGLRLARKLLLDIVDRGLPAGTEFLDTTFGQYYADLISWGAIGARTAESQIHRELASGLSMPVGIKNRTDGDVQVAIDGIKAASHRHLFPSLTKEGAPAIFETAGNQYCHLILRGGDLSGPNYDAEAVQAATTKLTEQGLAGHVVVDASHGNSQKDHNRQKEVVRSVCDSIEAGLSIKGVMLESHLNSGRQNYDPDNLQYGVSITDACLSFDETLPLLEALNETGS
ncbi:MAG: 3-deoxy-7-phosphoheptulonate synthase [Candidatus Azotimanducaceae bacterium]|jgi:3-deoxy-7-phosphoheptulonate synthase